MTYDRTEELAAFLDDQWDLLISGSDNDKWKMLEILIDEGKISLDDLLSISWVESAIDWHFSEIYEGRK